MSGTHPARTGDGARYARTGAICLVAAALGALAMVLPAVAGSETAPTVTAVNSTGLYEEQIHSWSPSHVTVGEGGSVTLTNPTTVPHGVRWVSSPATPACTSGVPVGTTLSASGTEWSGSCTFAQPGTYVFYCTVHGAAMSGTITVANPSEVPTGTNPSPSPTPTPGSPGTGSGSGAGAGGGEPGTAGTGAPGAGGKASPFAAGALKLASAQRGDAVHGSLALSSAAAGGRLEVDLLANGATLPGASGGHARRVRVGRFERGSLGAGTVRFGVALSAKARAALKHAGRLALTVRIELTPRGGRSAELTRAVVLRPPAR
ncbi:MAG TPA: plastocyanin/azurin family copper-binding protein [Solirubrobacteraceae bacterium]|nr:plastocyanin/azurin family copper-binding protein [Solirubrobacteraceae bacterium]